MSPSYVCPCCFLNRISILRESGGCGEHLQIQFNHKDGPKGVSSEAITTDSNVSLTSQFALSDTSGDNLANLEKILEKLKSGASFTSGFSDYNVNSVGDKNLFSESSIDSNSKTVFLAEQIDNVLREQKKFLRDLNLDLPIYEDEWYMVMEDEKPQQREGDCNWDSGNTKNKTKNSIQDFMNLLRNGKMTDCFFAGGDKLPENTSAETWKENMPFDDNAVPKMNKPTMYFNEEPVKLPKPFQYNLSSNDANFNKDYSMDKNISVKLLFFPEVALKGSSTSMMSDDCISSASVYVTAANSIAEQVPTHYTTADSSSSLQLKTTQSSNVLG